VSLAITLSPALKSLTCGPISTTSPATSVPESKSQDQMSLFVLTVQLETYIIHVYHISTYTIYKQFLQTKKKTYRRIIFI